MPCDRFSTYKGRSWIIGGIPFPRWKFRLCRCKDIFGDVFSELRAPSCETANAFERFQFDHYCIINDLIAVLWRLCRCKYIRRFFLGALCPFVSNCEWCVWKVPVRQLLLAADYWLWCTEWSSLLIIFSWNVLPIPEQIILLPQDILFISILNNIPKAPKSIQPFSEKMYEVGW